MVLDPHRGDHGGGELLDAVMMTVDLTLQLSVVHFSIASSLFFSSSIEMFLCFRFVFRRALLLRYVSFSLDGLILSKFLKSLLLIHDHPHDEEFLFQRESFPCRGGTYARKNKNLTDLEKN